MIRALGVSNLKPFLSPYTNNPDLMICRHLSFSIDDSAFTSRILPFNQINSSTAHFLISDQDLLQVSGLLKSQVSNFTSPQSMQIITTCPCRRGLPHVLADVVFHMSLLRWSADMGETCRQCSGVWRQSVVVECDVRAQRWYV
jgi:hypothetical protein